VRRNHPYGDVSFFRRCYVKHHNREALKKNAAEEELIASPVRLLDSPQKRRGPACQIPQTCSTSQIATPDCVLTDVSPAFTPPAEPDILQARVRFPGACLRVVSVEHLAPYHVVAPAARCKADMLHTRLTPFPALVPGSLPWFLIVCGLSVWLSQKSGSSARTVLFCNPSSEKKEKRTYALS
jgi:hypothetical protein